MEIVVVTFIGAGVALIAGANRQDPAQGKCSKTGDFDVNGEESGSEVFRSPFSRAQRVLQCNNRLAYAAASSAKRINLHCRMQHFILIPDIRLDAAGSVAEQSKRKRHPRR